MLMVAFLDQPQMLRTVVLGFLLLGLIASIEDQVHMVLLCSVTSGGLNSFTTVLLVPGEGSVV